ncbi:hypothetical protein J3R30DRAFT_1497136 [Lentinula aciculospora]|uniref:Mid2 domain-containing protein n=1 Tax=Lentinula aciculospora TaxID=153920 RepID=A0A9W9AQW5_9AGAR|nr:hypothetical protein J3R30DRAFT_1497136 [Lentinula aciculospora]
MLFVLLSLFYLLQTIAADTFPTVVEPSLLFSSGWRSSPSTASSNSFLTDTLGHALTITIPESTAKLDYVGFKRTGGSLYGVCVDCTSGTTSNLQLFSGHDNTLLDDSAAEPATIFSLNLDPNQAHILQVTNVGDSSFGRKSELTFISVVVIQYFSSISSATSSQTSASISSSDASSVFTTTSVSTSKMTRSTSTSVAISSNSISSMNTASVSVLPASGTDSSQTRDSFIAVITVPTIIAVLSLVIGLFFYYRKQHPKETSFVDFTEAEEPPTMQVARPSPSSTGFLATAGRKKPPIRLPEPYPDDAFVPQDGPIVPLRRLEAD